MEEFLLHHLNETSTSPKEETRVLVKCDEHFLGVSTMFRSTCENSIQICSEELASEKCLITCKTCHLRPGCKLEHILHFLSTRGQMFVLEESLFAELLDELTLGFCFEIHRSCKMGQLFLDETDEPSLKFYEIVNEPGRDVFGKPPLKKQIDCVCPHCNRNLSASRFAPHLEKCMGMGRNSSRLASKRIANSGIGKLDSDNEDDERDLDWSYAFDKKVLKKTKKDKLNTNSPRRSKPKCSIKNGDIPCGSSVTSDPGTGSISSYSSKIYSSTYEGLSLEERKRLLMSTCGVISEHTRKMCTKSLRCPQHTDEQRRIVRRYLLRIDPEGRFRMRPDGSLESDDIHVDIDSYEDGDGQALRETLNRIHQWEGNTSSANPSPADSTSTTNSQEKKRKKGGMKLTQRKRSKLRPPVQDMSSISASSSVLAAEYDILD